MPAKQKPQIGQRRKSDMEKPDNLSHTMTAPIAQDDEDFYKEPIKRIVRPDNQVNTNDLFTKNDSKSFSFVSLSYCFALLF